MSGPIVIEQRVEAAREVVWRFVSDPARWLSWQGVEAEIDATPGGAHRVNIRGDAFAGGRVVEVVPNERISFTWGFEIPDHPLPAGSTLVTIELIPQGSGTLVRLTHARVPEGFESVAEGWTHYLARLAIVACGGDPGPDPKVQLTTPRPPHADP